MSKNCHHNEKQSATGLFTKGQNLVADGQTSKMPSTTSGAGQTETNLGKQKRGCFVSEMISQVICSSFQAIDFAVKLITFSFPNNMNPARATSTFRTKCNNFHNIHPALPSPYILNDRGNPMQPDSRLLTRYRNPSCSAKTAQFRDQLLCAVHIRQSRTRRLRTDGVKRRKSFQFNCGLKSTAAREIAQRSKYGVMFCSDFVLKCDCSFPDNFFVTGRFQVGFFQNKSKIVLQ